jgi:hypothetical protein
MGGEKVDDEEYPEKRATGHWQGELLIAGNGIPPCDP